MPEYGDEQTISELVQELERGASIVFDSGHRDGSITVTRSKLPAPPGMPEPAFSVSGVTSAQAGLTATSAQADVARRRQIRDRAKVARANRRSGLAP